MTTTAPELWQLVIDRLRRSYLTMEPWGRGKQATRWTLFELYLVGERPTAADIRHYTLGLGEVDRERAQARIFAKLWAERLRQPARAVRGPVQWSHPFLLVHEVVVEFGLEPIVVRLATQAERSAQSYAASIAAGGDEETVRKLEEALTLQSLALRVWGQTVLARRNSAEVRGHVRLPARWRLVFPGREPPPQDPTAAS